MSGILYGRKTELFAGDLLFLSDDFTIYFDIPFDSGEDANVAEVKIYNLKDDTIKQLGKGTKLVVNAGYTGDVGAVLLGVVDHTVTTWESVDKITSMQVLDGADSWFSMPYRKTYAEGMTGHDILTDITTQTGLEIGAFELPDNTVYAGGKTLKTTVKGAIEQIAKDCGATAHVTRGKVFIRPDGHGNNIKFILDSEHGLIGSPTPAEKEIETGEKDADGNTVKVTKYGYKVKTLLNHRITTDAILEIHSKTASGLFIVDSGKHTAGSGSYLTEMEVYPA